MTFGDLDHKKSGKPCVLWCTECKSAVPLKELTGHWARKPILKQQLHKAGSGISNSIKERLLRPTFTMPLLKTAQDVAAIDLRPIARRCPRQVDELLSGDIGYACNVPSCGAVSTTATAFRDHGTLKHVALGEARPEPSVCSYQRLGRRRNWLSFQVDSFASEGLSDDQKDLIRDVLEAEPQIRVQAHNQETLNNINNSLPIFIELGLPAVLDGFDNDTQLKQVRQAASFQQLDPLRPLSRFVKNYIGQIGKECGGLRSYLAIEVRSIKA